MLIKCNPDLFALLEANLAATPFNANNAFYSAESVAYDAVTNTDTICICFHDGSGALLVNYKRRNVMELMNDRIAHIPGANKYAIDNLQTQISLHTGVYLADIEFDDVRLCANNIVQLCVSPKDPKFVGWITLTY